MGIEGLDLVLGKQEVVPTVSAADLLGRAERVENDYLRHVRTYVPINRAAEGREGVLDVNDYERKVIKAVKDSRSLRGYLTAEFGYGKTSTALYLWQRAQEANLLAVPPFQMLHLQDLITATHGWMRYRLGVRQPQLLHEVDSLYREVTGRSLEQEAQSKNVSLTALRSWQAEGRFILELQATDYIHYFEKATDLALKAGYEGLLVLADEVQQYIEPRILRSDDPIVPLFNLVQGLKTREGYLRFGLIMVIPLKELGVIREARGRDDLRQRFELNLDLTSIYDSDFAERLWGLLAKEFGFLEIADEVVASETLAALGQIAAREDLSNGPRTMINTFRRMVERYKSFGAKHGPYSPIELIDDFLAGAIQFAGNNQIQNVTRRALQNAIVRRQPERYEQAIKLAAAYPSAGVPLPIQDKYHIIEPIDELKQQALGELVIAVGPLDLHGVTLAGLQIGNQTMGWLPATIRDFRRAFNEQHTNTRDRAVRVFSNLLKSKLFSSWSLVNEREATLASNHSLLFEGEFQVFASKFPKRRVHVRIFWEGEERKDADIEGDVGVEFYLSLHPELRSQPEVRRHHARQLELNYEENLALIPINLMYVRSEGVPLQIQQTLQDVWSPYDLSPMVLMNIYEMLEEKRASGQIPPSDDAFIKSGFQPELLDSILRDLFNAEIGSPFGGVSQGRLVEEAIGRLLESRYGDGYRTMMGTATWRNTLQRYRNALGSLPNPYQKRGEVEVEGSKKEIADKFAFTNVTLDSFLRTFGSFLIVTREWRGNESGAVRYILHDLESKIMSWLRGSSKVERVSVGNQTVEVHALNAGEIFTRAQELGYRSDEIDELLKVLVERGMIEFYQAYLVREKPTQTVDLDGAAYALQDLVRNLKSMLKGFPENRQIMDILSDTEKWQKAVDNERRSSAPDPERVYRLGRNIQIRSQELERFCADRQNDLRKQLSAMRQGLRPIPPAYLNNLEKPVVGSVSYVAQVNALRRTVQTGANRVKAVIDALNNRIEKTDHDLRQASASLETLVRCAGEVTSYAPELKNAQTALGDFETNYQHLGNWERLVVQGSELWNELQQMGSMAAAQTEAYERIARDISARISSTSDKLGVLPDHSIYVNQLQTVREESRAIRKRAEDEFVDTQKQYYAELVSSGLYRREKIDEVVGRPLTYNLSDPEESYRLMYGNVQKLLHGVTAQLIRTIRRSTEDIQNTLATPLMNTLLPEERDSLNQDGGQIIEASSQILARLSQVETAIDDLSIIRSMSSGSERSYPSLILSLKDAREIAKEIDAGRAKIGDWLSKIALTPEENTLMGTLPNRDNEGVVDLIEWLKSADAPPDAFWRNLRSLYEKRYIRLSVGRVRR